MGVLEFITSIVAMVLGAITIWIMLLRKSRRRASPVDAHGKYDLNQLAVMAESMQERIEILESILDAEVPDWREQHEPGSK